MRDDFIAYYHQAGNALRYPGSIWQAVAERTPEETMTLALNSIEQTGATLSAVHGARAVVGRGIGKLGRSLNIKSNSANSSINNNLKFSQLKDQGLFEIHPRVANQLSDSRLGRLAGELNPEQLQKLVNNRTTQRFYDNVTGNINIVQDVNGKLLRITIPPDAKKIISVGPIRQRNIINGVNKGRFIPIN